MPFPLPLVPFESYMLADGSQAYPRAFVIEAQLTGKMNRAALEAAWPAALARHPLLTARIEKTSKGWHWVASAAAPPALDWGAEAEPLGFAGDEAIDLTREAGVRLWARAGDDEARLILQFHHACSDGVGGLQFLGDLLAIYARQVSNGPATPQLAPLDIKLLADRGKFGLTQPTLREFVRDLRIGFFDALRLVGRKPLAVRAPGQLNGAPQPSMAFPGYQHYTLGEAEFRALRQAARAAGATVNDLLMSRLFSTIVEWNATHSSGAKEGWLRINVPTNLRRREDEGMPAANLMSFTFVDRRTAQCRDQAALLKSIRDETQDIKRWRLGLYFIGQLTWLLGIPGGMSLMLKGNRCFATAVLTNVGDPARRFTTRFPRQGNQLVVGNLLLKNVTGSSPLRPLTHAAVAITTYAGHLTVSLQCDRRHFSPDETQQLLAAYIAQITAT